MFVVEKYIVCVPWKNVHDGTCDLLIDSVCVCYNVYWHDCMAVAKSCGR